MIKIQSLIPSPVCVLLATNNSKQRKDNQCLTRYQWCLLSVYHDIVTCSQQKLNNFLFSICLVDNHISPYFLMLVWWHERKYEINYSHFFRGGWCGCLKWCNMWAHKRIISASTIDFWPTLTYESTSVDMRQQHLTSFCAVCGVLFYYKKESIVVSSGVRDVMLATHICSHLAECLYATFCNQTWYNGAPPWASMSCEKMGFYLQGQGHSVGL